MSGDMMRHEITRSDNSSNKNRLDYNKRAKSKNGVYFFCFFASIFNLLFTLIFFARFRCLVYDRSLNFAWFAGDAGAGPYMSGLKKFILEKIVIKQIQNSVHFRSFIFFYLYIFLYHYIWFHFLFHIDEE
jgi:hypothetical protein